MITINMKEAMMKAFDITEEEFLNNLESYSLDKKWDEKDLQKLKLQIEKDLYEAGVDFEEFDKRAHLSSFGCMSGSFTKSNL